MTKKNKRILSFFALSSSLTPNPSPIERGVITIYLWKYDEP
jgi:hypothetical protein